MRSERSREFATRLFAAVGPDHDLTGLHKAACGILADLGLPLWRSSLHLELLHPEIMGKTYIWLAEGAVESTVAQHGVERTAIYLASPVRVVDETNQPFRRRLDKPQDDMPVLAELRDRGVTDYFLLPLNVVERRRTAAISFATAAPDGFKEAELADLADAAVVLGPPIEVRALRFIAINLLNTYLGRSAGEQVFDGRIRRGDGETIFAAIWFCDLGSFTTLTDLLPRETVIQLLNDWFDCMGGAVEENGGEVLKFLGDGLLAIFPAEAGAPGPACTAALAAARDAVKGVDALNAARAADGQQEIAFRVALHLGEVTYGNIGGRRRLDFTVIGPAVNHTSRLQELAKTLGRRVLISGDIAGAVTVPLHSLGRHLLRDVADPQEVFTLAD